MRPKKKQDIFRVVSNKELERMIRAYNGSANFLLSIKKQLSEKGFNRLTRKQRYYAERSLISQKSELNREYFKIVKDLNITQKETLIKKDSSPKIILRKRNELSVL